METIFFFIKEIPSAMCHLAQTRDCDVGKEQRNEHIHFLNLTLTVASVNKQILSSFTKADPVKSSTNHNMSGNYYFTLRNTI